MRIIHELCRIKHEETKEYALDPDGKASLAFLQQLLLTGGGRQRSCQLPRDIAQRLSCKCYAIESLQYPSKELDV